MSKTSVLIIEDDDVAAEILQQFMAAILPKAKIDWCWDGYEALVKLEEVKPDIILLDFMMPKLDGMKFLDQMKLLDPDHKACVIVISAYADPKMEKKFIKRGAYKVLPKPITLEILQPVIEEVTKKAKKKK